MANRSTRARNRAIRKACKAGTYEGGAPVLFGTNVDSSAEREKRGRKPYCSPTLRK